MSTKLYPPILNGVLPAFCVYDNDIESVILKIPFTMNKAVSPAEIDGFVLLIKTVASGTTIASPHLEKQNNVIEGWDQENNILNFRIDKSSVNIGQHYKVQLAYIADNIYGYYSNVATIKCTAEPTISIENLSLTETNTAETRFIGCYINDKDRSEKIYSYRFNVYSASGQLFDTSGDQLHNSTEDFKGQARDTFSLNKDLPLNETYSIEYSVTTVNNLTITSPRYSILQRETIDPDIKVKVIAASHRDNGYILVSLQGVEVDGMEPAAVGSFYLKRASNKDNYESWELIYSFKLNGVLPSQWSWKDMTIEQGHSYKYAIQQYSDYLISNRIESNVVQAEFDDMYLFDGEKQLRIKYNPQVSSFKTTLLESKQDTIGGKYPVFFRNGRVGYKEFPISGLLSYHSDDEELFTSAESLQLVDTPSTQLSDNNMIAERKFKLQVLDWLNNGKPKLFRSPTEGNYIVRLMNVSLAPNATLGRVLHTFSATAYEMCEFNYENVVNLKFLNVGNFSMDTITKWVTVDLMQLANETNSDWIYVGGAPITSFTISDAAPGTRFELYLNDGVYETNKNGTWLYDVPVNFAIGPTGMYKIDLSDQIKILKIRHVSGGQVTGQLTYSYETTFQNVFELVKDVKINNWVFAQYIGNHTDIIGNMEERVVYKEQYGTEEITKSFQGTKTQLLDIKNLIFYKREVYELYKKSNANEFYWDKACTNEATLLPIHIYHVTEVGVAGQEELWKQYYHDPSNLSEGEELLTCDNTIVINGEIIDLTDSYTFAVPDGCELSTIALGSGIICECAYRTKEIIYDLELTELKSLADASLNAYTTYLAQFEQEQNIIANDMITTSHLNSIAEKREAYKVARTALLMALHQKIQEKKEASGQ